MNEYMQVHKDLQQVDVVVLQEIENKLKEIFKYCKSKNLEFYVIMDYDFDLRFIVSKKHSRYIRLNGGEVNLFMSWNHFCDIGGEKTFYKELEQLLLRIKAINGVNKYIQNISGDCPTPPQDIPQDDLFW